MAHELEMIDGVAQMAYRKNGGLPWHALGTAVSDDMSPREMMSAAGLNWTVSKADTYAKYVHSDGEEKMIPTGRQALIRDSDGKVLTEVGKTWNPVQNEEAFDFFTDFVSSGDMMMDTAGSLKNGQIVWALADIKSKFTVFGGDEVTGYLLFTNPHQFGKTIDIRFCATRVVCNNTLTMAIRENGKQAVKVNHRRKFDADAVKKILGIASEEMSIYKQKAEILGSRQYAKSDLEKYFGNIFGMSDNPKRTISTTAEKAMNVISSQPGAEYAEGTFWQLFNAATYTIDHLLGRTAASRLETATYGGGADKKLKALELALEMSQ